MIRLTHKAATLLFVMIVQSCSTLNHEALDPLVEARGYIEGGQLESGLALLEKAMKNEPERLALSNYYRFQASKNKQYERSISYFKEAVESNLSEVDEMYYNLAFAYIDKIPSVGPMGAGFLSKRAIKQFEVVLERDPDDWAAVYGIGMNYLHWPDYFKKNDEAIAYLEKTLNLQQRLADMKPYYILTYIRLGDAYAKSGRFEDAYRTWHQGLVHYPEHSDLVSRVNTPTTEIADAIQQLYSPNNSIGKINTDIAVLWESQVPDTLVPLTDNALQQPGVGGLIKGAEVNTGVGEIGLFAWFMRNLPFLSDKAKFQNVDMSSLGIAADGKTQDLASIVAHGMIMGFLSQFEEESAVEARAKSEKLDTFYRPFFHEGLGMGYAATASLDDVGELKNLIVKLKEIDPRYTRLHLAGAGMWYGLESTGRNKVREAFGNLGAFGEAYAYEGYGFSQTLFHFKNRPEVILSGEALGDSAARSYYHGAGRALWILNGRNLEAFGETVERIPLRFRADAHSGYGMGVAFTNVQSPHLIFSLLEEAGDSLDWSQFLVGVSMGITIRDIADDQYIEMILADATSEDACRIHKALDLGRQSLAIASNDGGDQHADWRKRIYNEIVEYASATQWKACL